MTCAIFLYKIIIIFLCQDLVRMDNTTHKYMRMDNFQGGIEKPRFPRLFTFNTEEDDVTVDLEFAVPFITIPVKRTVDSALGLATNGLANVNVGAVILAGATVFGGVFLGPLISSLFHKNIVNIPFYRRAESNELWHMTSVIDEALEKNNISLSACLQRSICWLVKNSTHNVKAGKASSNDKIIEAVANHAWLHTWIQGTAVESVIQSGLQNSNCAAKYKNCNISRKSLSMFMNHFMKISNKP